MTIKNGNIVIRLAKDAPAPITTTMKVEHNILRLKMRQTRIKNLQTYLA